MDYQKDGVIDDEADSTAADDGFEISRELNDALEGNREMARLMWHRVAVGHRSAEEQLWIKVTAERILAADDDEAKTRPQALTKAIGLHGKRDQHWRLRQVATTVRDFEFTPNELKDELEELGLFDSESLLDMDSILNREMAKEPRER
jgi:hypothetical protein